MSLQRVAFTAYGNDPANWIAALPHPGASGIVDSDGDGIPDAWEDAHGLNKFVNDANLDPDHDGFSNLQEYLAGTDPQNPNSFLRIDQILPSLAGTDLKFQAVPGHTYSVMYCDSLTPGTWTKLADVSAPTVPQLVTVSDSAPLGQFQRYYRLVTPQMP
jgi:hypothetical protein